MPTYAILTGRITKPGSDIGVRTRVTASPMTTDELLKLDDRLTVGPETAETGAGGNLPAADFKVPVVTGILWRITAEALDKKAPGPKAWTVGTFEISAGTHDIRALANVTPTVVEPTLVQSVSDMAAAAELDATEAAASATAADTAKTAAETAKTAAETAATTATGAAGTATTKATEATTAANTATTKASEANTSATAAATARTAAETARDDAADSATEAQGYAQQAAGSVSLVAWAPATAYAAGDVRQAPDGSAIRRTANGTSGAVFDATEEAAWTSVLADPTTVAGKGLTATIAGQTATVNAADYGLSAAGTASANVTAIHAAFAAVPEGGTLLLPPLTGADEYAIVGLDLRGKSFTLRAENAPLRKAAGATGETAVQIGGSITLDVTTLTVAASEGATTLTVASTTGLAVGDLVRLRSSAEVFSPDRPDLYFKGELFEVGSIDSGTTLTLKAGTALQDSYSITATTVTLDVLAPVAVKVHGLTVAGPGDATPMYGIKAWHFDGLLLDGLTVRDFPRQGISVSTGRNATIVANRWDDCDEDGIGYGCTLTAVDGATVADCEGHRNRHTIDITGGATDPPSRNVTYRNVRAYHDKSAGISTHGCSENVTVDGCQTVWCGGGIVTRGRNTSVVNSKVIGLRQVAGQSYDHAIMVGDGSVANPGLGGHNLRVSGNLVDLGGAAEDAAINALRVFVDLVNADIVDNTLIGAPGQPVVLSPRSVDGLLFARNRVDATRAGTAGTAYAVLLDHAGTTDTELHRDIRFEDNTIEALSTRYASCLRITGGSTATRATQLVSIERNTLDGYATSAVQLNSGYFAGIISINRNLFPKTSSGPTTTVSLAATFAEAVSVKDNRYAGHGHGFSTVASAAPTSGYHRLGSIVWNISPTAGGFIGWVCVTAGSPGTWKTFGAISA